jgi:hypothetical protein
MFHTGVASGKLKTLHHHQLYTSTHSESWWGMLTLASLVLTLKENQPEWMRSQWKTGLMILMALFSVLQYCQKVWSQTSAFHHVWASPLWELVWSLDHPFMGCVNTWYKSCNRSSWQGSQVMLCITRVLQTTWLSFTDWLTLEICEIKLPTNAFGPSQV